MKKVLVTGGAGFIGTNLIDRLLKEGYQVFSLDNYYSGTKNNHIEGCTYLEGDIESIKDLDGSDFNLVFHLAALPRIQPSFENPTETFRVNTVGTKFVLEWARRFNVRVIYSGSSSRWHDPFQSPYACFKHLGEELCKLYQKCYGVDVEIARFYNVYGPKEIIDGDWAAVIGIWRRQVRDELPITIVGDGEQRRDFTHVDDIIDGLYKISVSGEKHDDAWELGTGTNYSINQVYEMFREKFGVNKIHLPDRKGNYRVTLRESNDTVERLGWKPEDKLKNYVYNL